MVPLEIPRLCYRVRRKKMTKFKNITLIRTTTEAFSVNASYL